MPTSWSFQAISRRHSDVFNIKHLVPYTGDSSNEDQNSRMNSFQHGENDVDHTAFDFMRKTREDICVQTPCIPTRPLEEFDMDFQGVPIKVWSLTVWSWGLPERLSWLMVDVWSTKCYNFQQPKMFTRFHLNVTQ